MVVARGARAPSHLLQIILLLICCLSNHFDDFYLVFFLKKLFFVSFADSNLPWSNIFTFPSSQFFLFLDISVYFWALNWRNHLKIKGNNKTKVCKMIKGVRKPFPLGKLEFFSLLKIDLY